LFIVIYCLSLFIVYRYLLFIVIYCLSLFIVYRLSYIVIPVFITSVSNISTILSELIFFGIE
jgi:hypothetical protein